MAQRHLAGVDAGFAKVAGVLVTTSLRGNTVDHALVGIGINVLDGAQDLPPGATTIQVATGVSATPDEVLHSVLERFGEAYVAFVAADGRPSLDGWLLEPRSSARWLPSWMPAARVLGHSSGSLQTAVF